MAKTATPRQVQVAFNRMLDKLEANLAARKAAEAQKTEQAAKTVDERARAGTRRIRWRGLRMTFDPMLADRITALALDRRGAETDDVGAAWLDGYAKALGDLEHGALPGDALQLARDARMVLGLLPALVRRRDEVRIDGVFRVVKRLMDDAACLALTARELRLFWAVAAA